MKPIFVCQLSEEKQAKIKTMLEGLILHGCGGDKSEVERYYEESFEKVVEEALDCKIDDLIYMLVFYAEEFNSGKADESFHLEDAAVLSSILKEARKHDEVPDWILVQSWHGDYPMQEYDWDR